MKAIILAALCLSACAGAPVARPEPIIQIREVRVPVVGACPAAEAVGPGPAYPDTDAALASAANLFERVKLLLAGRVLRVSREGVLVGAVNACR